MRARLPARAALGLVVLAVTSGLAPRPTVAAIEVRAQLDRSRIASGETTTLEVIVSGSGATSEPQFQVPDGVEVLGSSRAQSFSWVNGQSSSQTVFRYELGSSRTGQFRIGPVRVRSGNDVYSTAPLVLEVSPGGPGVGGPPARGAPGGRGGGRGAQGPASLVTDVAPREPWLGQPVILRVRLIQREALAEDPQYGPPSTTGFWAEAPSKPTSYYGDEGGRRVLVTETHTRLYPLSSGDATIGQAVVGLTLAGATPFDPFSFPGMGRRRVEVRSDPLPVRVRALPSGAPPGFDGAVGSLSLAWSADRDRTSQDVAISLRLDVRGVGNLPMIHTPALSCGDCEVFTGPVDDSLGSSDSDAGSRRSFRWTVLPRHTGRLEIPAPEFAWFDPAGPVYRRAELPPLEVEVGPSTAPGAAGREAFPQALADHPVDPLARPARPWAGAAGGLLVGAGIAMWRSTGRRPADAGERAQQRQWLQALRGSGPEFWRAADDACAWLERRGRPAAELRRDIAAARYTAGFADPERFRGRLTSAIAAALPAQRRGVPLRALAVIVMAAGIAAAVAGGPRWGSGPATLEAATADGRARGGDIDGARAAWLGLWQSGVRDPALAARLAWTALRSGEVGEAALWAMRGDRGEPRDPALRWAWERVRESGGLTGAGHARLPLRSTERAGLALLLGAAAGLLWPRWRWTLVAASLALACGALAPVERWRALSRNEAVVRAPVTLEGVGLELAPGQVVRVRERDHDLVAVSAGRDIAGRVPATAIVGIE